MSAVLFPESIIGTTYGAGYKLYFYEVGTTTDLTVYQDFALGTAHSQPIVADANGIFAAIYLDATGNDPKIVLTTDADVEVWTLDRFPIEDTTTLASNLSTAESNISTLQGEMATNDSDISTLTSESADYETRITALEGGGTAPTVTIFTSSGTYTKPSGLKAAKVTVIGGGGGGVEYSNTTCGGAGGGCSIKLIAAASVGATETVTVGTGGVGKSASPGNDGGTSSFGAHCSATGGKGGLSVTTLPSEPGVGSNGDINLDGFAADLTNNPAFGHTAYHGGGSFLGGSKVSSSPNTPGAGGAPVLSGAGQDGSDGIVIVENYF